MKKLLSALAVLLLLASPAYGQKTKSGMTTEINNNLPDNTINEITPGILRSTLIDMVNSWYGLIDATNSGTGASTFGQLTVTGTSSFTGNATFGQVAVGSTSSFTGAASFGQITASAASSFGQLTTSGPFSSTGTSTFGGAINQNGSGSGTVTLQTQSAAGTWNWNWPTSAGTAGQVLTSQGGVSNAMTWTGPLFSGAVTTTNTGNPAGTTSTSGVMQGDGSSCHITPTQSTRVLVTFTGNISNNTASDGALAAIRVGTGTAPVNGAAATGSAVGGNMFITNNANTAGMTVSVTPIGIVTGLTLNTAYWFDILQQAITGGTATFQNVTCTIVEI